VTVRYAGRGDLVGLASLLTVPTQVSGAEAVTDTTLGLFSFDHLRTVAWQEPALCWAIAEQIADFSTTAVTAVLEAGSEPMRARVARHLLAQALPAAEGPAVVRITHQRLADAVGTAREVITRLLRDFREEGVIATAPGRVIISDPALLADIAREVARTPQA
jgi:CRP/FNR family transcriptional regulator